MRLCLPVKHGFYLTTTDYFSGTGLPFVKIV